LLMYRTTDWTRRRLTSRKMKNKICQKNKNIMTTATTNRRTEDPRSTASTPRLN
jgi:hypothetical protein